MSENELSTVDIKEKQIYIDGIPLKGVIECKIESTDALTPVLTIKMRINLGKIQ